MKTFLEQLGIAWLGLATTLLVVAIDVTVLKWAGISLVGTLVWIIPAGAIVGGVLAASGYYLGARYTHSRASPPLLVLMVIIAVLAYFLIYWFDYTQLEVDGEPVRNSVTFWNFVDYRLTHSRLYGRHFLRGIDLGVFGYVLAGAEFIGFLLGGVVAYSLLSGEKMCPSCNLYFSSLMVRNKSFADVNSAVSYVDALRDALADPQSITDNAAFASLQPIPAKVTFELLGCPICKRQVLEQKIAVRDGEDWKDIGPLAKTFEVSVGVDVRSRIEELT
jgi:hypothetical protein